MKKQLSIVLILLFGIQLHAQKVIEKNIEYKNQKINFYLKYASTIEINSWDKSEVYVKATIQTDEKSFTEDFELNVAKTSDKINIEAEAEKIIRKIWAENNKKNPGNVKQYNDTDKYTFSYEIYVPKKAAIYISSMNAEVTSKEIEGDFSGDLINGNFKLKKYTGDLFLSTVNGEIDLKIVDASVVAETTHGKVFAAENLKTVNVTQSIGRKVIANTKKPISSLQLSTVNGTIYLR